MESQLAGIIKAILKADNYIDKEATIVLKGTKCNAIINATNRNATIELNSGCNGSAYYKVHLRDDGLFDYSIGEEVQTGEL